MEENNWGKRFSEYKDITLTCIKCKKRFIFSCKDQQFFESLGYKRPKLCKQCKQKRKEREKREYI